MFIKRGDGVITHVIKTEDLNEEQEATLEVLAKKSIKQIGPATKNLPVNTDKKESN